MTEIRVEMTPTSLQSDGGDVKVHLEERGWETVQDDAKDGDESSSVSPQSQVSSTEVGSLVAL